MEILTIVFSAISGGLITQLLTARFLRTKSKAEAGQMISEYYRSEIEYLSNQVSELRNEVKELTAQLQFCKKCKLKQNE